MQINDTSTWPCCHFPTLCDQHATFDCLTKFKSIHNDEDGNYIGSINMDDTT